MTEKYQNNLPQKPIIRNRLTIIISMPIETAEEAKKKYEAFTEPLKGMTEGSVSGNFVVMFDPCCGKIPKKT